MSVINIKELNTNKLLIKDNQRAIKIDDKVFVVGIGGDSIPINNLDNVIKVGYASINEFTGDVFFNNIQDGTTQKIQKLYVADTKLEEPTFDGEKFKWNFLKFAISYIDFSLLPPFIDSQGQVNFTNVGTINTSNKWATLNSNGYLQGDKVICGGNTTKTFVCIINLYSGSRCQIFQQGNRSGSCLFSLVYGRDSNYLGWHGWSQDYPSWQYCSPGKHSIIIEYSAESSTLTVYIDGIKGSTLNITNYCGDNYKLRLGYANADDWYHGDSFDIRLFAAYDRLLTTQQILYFNQFIND